MKINTLIRQAFLTPFTRPDRRYIGVELEFPLLNLAQAPVDRDTATTLMAHMMTKGFDTVQEMAEGHPVFIQNAAGDVLSFDNSYNNFEFSMAKDENLADIARRFYTYYAEVQAFLLPRRHKLCGLGTNPFQPFVKLDAVDIPIYGIIRAFLSAFSGGAYHTYPDFPAYLSSIQTHLDVPLAQLPRALTLYAALDFVRALLFSNSLPFPQASGFSETVCFRDYLWERSGFGSLSCNVGKPTGPFACEQDIIDAIARRSLFFRMREGRYERIQPQTLADYFATEGQAEDLDCYLSFQTVEVTRRGTLEIRSDCAQPVREAFVPAAFNLGILQAVPEAEALLSAFFTDHGIPETPDRNRILRDRVVYQYQLPAAREAVRRLLLDLVALAEHGLKSRGMGEEALLQPLYTRAEQITCPAREMRRQLARGADLTDIIQQYSAQ